ncbi:MAG: XTP/dITP diphosphatase [Candidatus Omnitrophica bacterium]|nr:XTP/dITP diphosphatase [Candidatus Omnitrophota bacterium]
MEIVVATRNAHKLAEIQALLGDAGITAVSLAAFPDAPPVVEDGATFAENAAKKALLIARSTGRLTVADDSGLEVPAIGGAPGVLSARYAGARVTDAENNAKLLQVLAAVPKSRRRARFVCCVAIAAADGLLVTLNGTCAGRIAFSPQGEQGFGYDPLFYLPRYAKTFAELPAAIKNKISHRGRAFAKANVWLRRYLRRGAVPPPAGKDAYER